MQNLFGDFQAVTAKAWKNNIIRDLKGEAYETLIWANENGFNIEPFYTSENQSVSYEPVFTHSDWEVAVSGKSKDSKELNSQLLEQLNSGASSISINVGDLDLDIALNEVKLNFIHSIFHVNKNNASHLKSYLLKNYELHELNCSVFYKKIGNQQDLEDWGKTILFFKDFERIRTISIDVLQHHNRNCLAYYEIALLFSKLVEYIECHSLKSDWPSSKIAIKVGVSSDYFIQMAKLRAIRRLWLVLKNEYGLKNDIHLIVETGLTNKSISENYNNLLRTTTEAMAAVSGGCNELIVNEFDVLFETEKKLSARMAVNQQLILKHESYFDKMADIACGSFYVEAITDALAEKALEALKYFEQQGGYFKCSEKNVFSEDIARQAVTKEKLFKEEKQIAIGVNKFRNAKEKIELPASSISMLQQLLINNPVLNYELERYLSQNA